MQRVCWHPGARMAAKSSQNRDAIVMTRLVPVTLAGLPSNGLLQKMHSSDDSNGDASRNQIHKCDDSQSKGEAKLGSIQKSRDRWTPARRRFLGTRLVAIRAAAPKFSSHGSR